MRGHARGRRWRRRPRPRVGPSSRRSPGRSPRLEEGQDGRLVGEELVEDGPRHHPLGQPQPLLRRHVGLVELEHALAAAPRPRRSWRSASRRSPSASSGVDPLPQVLLLAQSLDIRRACSSSVARLDVARGRRRRRSGAAGPPRTCRRRRAPCPRCRSACRLASRGRGQDALLRALACPASARGVARGPAASTLSKRILASVALPVLEERLALGEVLLDALRPLGGLGRLGRVVADLRCMRSWIVALGAGVEGLGRLLGLGQAGQRLLELARPCAAPRSPCAGGRPRPAASRARLARSTSRPRRLRLARAADAARGRAALFLMAPFFSSMLNMRIALSQSPSAVVARRPA